jgi:diguanylate cyclase (GGDEF)-like protein
VLIAEDSITQRARCRDLLNDAGFEVHEAPDGRTALDLCRIIRPDLLLLDLELPQLDGRQVLARLRADGRIGRTPVLVLTADERETTVAAVFDAGADDFVAKPPRPMELVARVNRILHDKADLDDLRERNRLLSAAAEIDVLTGLPNRRASAGALAIAAERARDSDQPLTVALIDVDHFKRVNDTYGHDAGDEVLRIVAERLRLTGRTVDLIGRWGGEEFIAVLPETGPKRAAASAETLRRACAEADLALGEHRLRVTVSVGWASATATPAKELVTLADLALYQAKASGRNCVCAAS